MNAGLARLRRSGCLRPVDVALADWIVRALPGASDDAALAAALAARAVAAGHSAMALDATPEWLAGFGEGDVPPLPDTQAWRAALADSPAVHVHTTDAPTALLPLVLDAQGRVYLRRYFEYERRLARALVARTHAGSPSTRSRIARPESRTRDLDPEQERAIGMALARRFTLVTGGPGTGKTHGVARMLAALADAARAHGETLRVALAAPTGKAAARLGESLRWQLDRLALPADVAAQIPRDAQTVHRLLGISPWRPLPKFDRATPLPFDVVVVDEVSMVDLPLMAKLVDAVPESARLILLGDPDQLSAVEAGNVLGALVEAADNGPLRDCHAPLTRSHRFDPDSPLGSLANAIVRGDADAALRACSAGSLSLVEDARTAPLLDSAVAAYQPVIDAGGPAAALHAARGYRVLTALRHGPSGCLALDRAIAARLRRGAGVRGDEQAWRGRLVLVTANRPELGLFNGDTGVLWPDGNDVMQAWFEAGDGTPRALPSAALPPHEGAFALTVHKAQGSEFERVALVTGPDSPVLTRELLYTGVTRARTGVAVYAARGALRTGIERRTLRMTGLADRLREAQASPAPGSRQAGDTS